MIFLYPLLIAFLLVFVSELGDKTQLLVLSFSSKLQTSTILIGVALGSFFSHGIAILFGSSIGLVENSSLHFILEIVTYSSFIVFGILAKYFTINLATSFKKVLFPLFILYGGSIFCIGYIKTIEELYILYSISEILLPGGIYGGTDDLCYRQPQKGGGIHFGLP